FPLYQDMVETIFKENRLKNYSKVADGLQKLQTLYSKPEYLLKSKSIALSNIKYEHSFKSAIITGLNLIKWEGKSLVKRKGEDFVSNIFHQLPVVFFFNNTRFHDLIKRIVSFL